jgi:hypothetical protein
MLRSHIAWTIGSQMALKSVLQAAVLVSDYVALYPSPLRCSTDLIEACYCIVRKCCMLACVEHVVLCALHPRGSLPASRHASRFPPWGQQAVGFQLATTAAACMCTGDPQNYCCLSVLWDMPPCSLVDRVVSVVCRLLLLLN